MDAAVILVVDNSRYVFAVLQKYHDYSFTTIVSNGFKVPLTSNKNWDRIPSFSLDSSNKKIQLQFWARDPNQYNFPGSIMGAPVAIPTLLTLNI